MTKWLLYLLFSPLLTPSERQTLKEYYAQQRASFCERHLVAGPELSKELDELDRQLDEEDRK